MAGWDAVLAKLAAGLLIQLLDLAAGKGAADLLLDELGRGVAHQHAVVAADVIDDGIVKTVATHTGRALVDNAAQGDDAHLGGAAADVDHHGAAGLAHGQAGTDSGGHRLLDQIDLAGAGTQGGFADGAALDLR